MNHDDETRYAIALTLLTGFNYATALQLYRELGSAAAVYQHRNDIGDALPDSTPRLRQALQQWDDALARADAELQFAQRYAIQVLTPADSRYPARLHDCPDAPLVLYYRGTADLNQRRIVSIVGTRRSTTYGHDLVARFMQRLRELCPQVLIVSGLAYGIDICAHRQALNCGYETVAVLAHGLERIYPPLHRETAQQMASHGGLLTEYLSGAVIDKQNFVRRNRIVAGMADATILVESAAKGGGRITCRIAQDYGRQVFAFPGPVGATSSEGCNFLIRDNGAALITSADDFALAMEWTADAQLHQAKADGIERNLFPDLSADERRVVAVLDEMGDLQLNMLCVKTNFNAAQLTALLFALELKGVVRPLAGGSYHLLR